MGFGVQFQEISYWQMDFNRNKKNKEIKEDEWEDDEREEAEAKIMFKFGVDAFIDLNTGYFVSFIKCKNIAFYNVKFLFKPSVNKKLQIWHIFVCQPVKTL